MSQAALKNPLLYPLRPSALSSGINIDPLSHSERIANWWWFHAGRLGLAFTDDIHIDSLPIFQLIAHDAFEVLKESFLDFTLLSYYGAIYGKSSDGVTISFIFDALME